MENSVQPTAENILLQILSALNQLELETIDLSDLLGEIDQIFQAHLPDNELSLTTSRPAIHHHLELWQQDQIIGYLAIHQPETPLFSTNQITFLYEQITLVIRKVAHFMEMAHLNNIAETFRQISLEITSTLDQQEVLQRVLRHLKQILHYDTASVWLLNDQGQSHFVLGEGHTAFGIDSDPDFKFDIENTPVLQQILKTKKPVIIPNVYEYAHWIHVEGYEWLHSWATAPIIIYDEVIGHLSLDHHETNFYSDADSDILEELARLLSIAVKNARLYASIRQRDEQSRAMLNAIPDQMFRLHADGIILDYQVPENQNVLIDPEDIIGQTFDSYWETDTAQNLKMYVQKALTIQQVQIYEYQLQTAAETLFFEARLALCGSNEVIALVRNITERKQVRFAIEQSEKRYRKIIEEAGDAIFTLDAAGQFTYMNPRMQNITGYGNDVLGIAYTKFVVPEWQAQVQHFFEGSPRRRIPETTLEIPLITADGSEIWTEQKITLFMDENQQVTGFQSILRDVSVRKRFETELKKAKEQAEIANLAKSRFLANMSHELRTPLNAILGFTQLMLRDQTLEQEQKENVRTIFRSGQHLLDLINDVLEMSKIEAGHISLKENNFDFRQLMDTLTEMFDLRAERKGIRLKVELDNNLPHYVLTDEGKLRQILINLVGNAIKFTTQGEVKILVYSQSIVESEALNIHFEVHDTGPGIPASELAQLFEAFVQSSVNEPAHEGTGLGLAIAKQFVEMMAGEISVTSQVGQGSTFYFYVRVRPIHQVEVVTERRKQHRVIGLLPNQPNYRILIVEDRFENRTLLVRLLKAVGFVVKEAENGREAIEIWQDWQPHLIWMDMRMPIMDGFEATQYIKGTEQGKNTIIISLTASVFNFEQEAIYEAGCDDYVAKPFREHEIFEKMQVYLGVQYIYDDEKDKQLIPAQELVASDLATLSQSMLYELYEAAVQIDREQIASILDAIHNENAQLAEQLKQLVRNYRFDKIINLIDAIQGSNQQ